MKSKRMLSTLLTLSLVTSMVLVGCGGNNSSATAADGESTGENGIDKEQYLNVLTKEPKTLDVSKATDAYASDILVDAMDALTRIEKKGDGPEEPAPAAAESWKTSEDGLTWTFKIREHNWSDGKPVTAKDFEYSLKRTVKPETASQYAFLLFPIKNAEAINAGKMKIDDLGVKAIDDHTLEFTLENPCAYFLNLTYFKVMQPQRQDIVEKYGDTYGSDVETLIFNGPFKITEWSHDHQVVLEKNEEYWDKDKVKLDKITMRIIKEEPSRMAELQNGTLDTAGVTKPEWIKKMDETGNFNVINAYDGTTTYDKFNTQDKYMKNAKIRKAFIIASDREGSVSTLFKGMAEPANAWCPPAVNAGEKSFREQSEDWITKLKEENPDPKELLKEGLKEEGLDPDPAKHTFKYLQSGTSASDKEFADFAQQNFTKVLGVQVIAELADFPTFQKRTQSMDYQIAGQAWTGDYNDPRTFFDLFLSNSGLSHTGWKSEKYDEIIAKTEKTMDQTERAKLFKEAEKMLIFDEGVISPGVYRKRNTYVAKYVKDMMYPLFGSNEYKYVYTSGRK